MKKNLLTVLLTVLMSMVGVKAYAYDIAAANAGKTIYYVWTNNKTELSVNRSYSDKYSGTIVIPESVEYGGNTYSVTSISENAFRDCSGLTSVSIPNSVTSIGESAFSGCTDLTSITIPNSVTYIGQYAFSGTAWYNNLPDGLVYAGKVAYKYKGEIPANTHITIDEGTTCITKYAFYECSGLTSVTLPNSLTYIGDNAFNSCGLSSVVIPDNVKTIGEHAFFSCSSLTSVTIGCGVTLIEDDAFASCNNLTSVYISDLAAWCKIRFYYEYDLHNSNPLRIAHHLYLNGVEIEDLTIPNSVTSIGRYAFSGCSGLISVTIPNSVTSIGGAAFGNCTNMTDVYCYAKDVPNTGDNAFDGTPTETSILHVPASAVEAYRAAWPWSDFKEIVPLDDTPLIDNGIIFALKDDGTLEVVGLEAGVTTVDILETVTIDGTEYQVTSIGTRAFEGRDDIEYLSIPWSVKSIGEYAFIDCGSSMTVNIADPESWCKMELGNEHSSPLSSAGKVLVHDIETDQIDIPEGVNSIGNYIFYQCRCIKTLTIPGSVATIGSSAFEDCTSLSSVGLAEGLETIGGSAFEGCFGLSSITIPRTVTTIYMNAFNRCPNLVYITSEIQNPFAIETNVFSTYENAILRVPSGTRAAYMTTAGWNRFLNIVDDATGFENVQMTVDGDSEIVVHALNGQKVARSSLRDFNQLWMSQPMGVYIVNGQKRIR